MGKIIAITAGKGGCGKTILTAALAWTLAESGKKTCAVDTCLGMRGLDMALRVQDKVVFDLFDLSEDVCPMEQALISVGENLRLIAAPQVDVSGDFGEKDLEKTLERLSRRFDYVLLDTAGVTLPFSRLACRAAAETILVSMPGEAAARNTERAAAILRDLSDTPISLCMNRFKPAADQPMPDATAAYLDLPLIGVIPEIIFSDGVSPDQFPAKIKSAVSDMAQRLEGRQIPLGKLKARRFPWLG